MSVHSRKRPIGISLLSAALGCVSLWRMRPVAARAFLWWSLTVVAVFIFFLVNSPRELWMASLLMVIVVALFLWALLRYVLRAVSPSL